MSRQIVIEGTTGIGVAATILAAGLAIGGGAFFGGYALGERNAPAAPQDEVAATELPERVYTAEDLEEALEGCGRPDVEVDGGVAVVPPKEDERDGGCVLTWFDAPGPVRVTYSTPREWFGDTGSVAWSNVTFDWERISGGREVTITVE